jgi:hypothetical protein
MALNELNKDAISFKKLVGKAHTQETFAFTEEPITSNIQISFSTVFGNAIDPLPVTNGGLTGLTDTDGVVEKLRFEIDLIPDTEIGTNQSQGYRLKLPSGYSGALSSTFSGGTYLNEALGKLQIVPSLYGELLGDGTTEYEPRLFETDGLTEITKFDSIDWILDTYNGILFVQSPPAGYDVSAERPAFMDAYLYVGDYLDATLTGATSASTSYQGASPSTVTVGGMPSGTNLTGRSFESLFEEILTPFQAPTFSAFNNSITNPSEVGVTLSGFTTFTWSTTNSANISANTIGILDITTGTTLLTSGLVNDGNESVNIGTLGNTVPTTFQWQISGLTTQGGTITRNVSKSTIYPYFYGKSGSGTRPSSNQALINSGTKVVAASTGSITINFGATDEWIWFATPATSTTKTVWTGTNSPSNTGDIGGSVSPGGNLFPVPDTVSIDSPSVLWAGINYKIYVSNFVTSTPGYNLILSNS